MDRVELSRKFWEAQYESESQGWDLGEVSKPLKNYFDQIKDKSIKILIPGAGNSYEAEYLSDLGFKEIYVLDWSRKALNNLKKRASQKAHIHYVNDDFFNHQSKYDLIVEQTFFCAIDPSLRSQYSEKMADLLESGGKLVGVLFNFEEERDHPPYGGNREEYIQYFSPYFKTDIMEAAYNSHAGREGIELFIKLVRK
ncbi:MAG: SAM-dependent methyltransferase [Chitinophagales bacterium]|nr:SAM-dependent methyltransferase [Chitinophagales bacterium]